MQYMTCAEIRETFLQFFESQTAQHVRINSSALVPGNDPSLLFTNAGMVQFKGVFLGLEQPAYKRATSSQKCLRVGGKHNDLEQVGFTKRHHTFFEMLGNFSFGDYFKQQAIEYAWQFLTVRLAIPAEKLWVTVYHDDDESADIWLKHIGLSKDRVIRCGEKDNFWSMGDTGPCGPCTEIFYDHGPDIEGDLPGTDGADGDRYVEIWNIVFMQYDRQADGALLDLPKPSVDTGMGLERIAAVMQGVHDNFDIDLFRTLTQAIQALCHGHDLPIGALKVIADHIRAIAFLITDGIYPSNEGRGYVLRRIIRRAVRFGYQAGVDSPFLFKLVPVLVDLMGKSYPELSEKSEIITDTLQREEQQFYLTIRQGMGYLEKALSEAEGVLKGEVVFQLYDTYGFPLDLTKDVALERHVDVDEDGYHTAMAQQRAQSKNSQQFTSVNTETLDIDVQTHFVGYEQLQADAELIAIYKDGARCESLCTGDQAILILNVTPCYGEGGGQVGDRGEITSESGVFIVQDTQKQAGVFLHHGVMQAGRLALHSTVSVSVDQSRQKIRMNHTATHLLHAALRHILGEHVVQKGSLVDMNRLRFDFSHHSAIDQEVLQSIEDLVNTQINRALPAQVALLTPEQAKQSGAMALFDEKYGDTVRVVGFSDFSLELCGGTHVNNTAEIGAFKLVSETGIASGIRRIEAITGQALLVSLMEKEARIQQLSKMLKGQPENIEKKVQGLIADNKMMQERLVQYQQSSLSQDVDTMIEAYKKLACGTHLIRHVFNGMDMKTLRKALDIFKSKVSNDMPSICILSSVVSEDKAFLLVYVSELAQVNHQASAIFDAILELRSGSGGGKKQLAQGALTETHDLISVFETAMR